MAPLCKAFLDGSGIRAWRPWWRYWRCRGLWTFGDGGLECKCERCQVYTLKPLPEVFLSILLPFAPWQAIRFVDSSFGLRICLSVGPWDSGVPGNLLIRTIVLCSCSVCAFWSWGFFKLADDSQACCCCSQLAKGGALIFFPEVQQSRGGAWLLFRMAFVSVLSEFCSSSSTSR